MAPDADTGTLQRADPFLPLTSESLAVGDRHEIYVESVGRVGGIPAVYLHGGPGSGCQADHRRLFDPERFHAVLFDQRGAGRSRPKRARNDNTLAHLIADMELIREKFAFERWMVVGGSWGATLALAYAQSHPDRVSGLMLRATFLGDPDPAVHVAVARAWRDTEHILSEHQPARARLDLASLRSGGAVPATPFMEAHYFQSDCFLRPNQLLSEAGRLADIPGIIVQGRYDLLCPPATSHALAAVWPAAELRIIEASGHVLYHPGIRNAVMRAIADLASKLTTQTGTP